MRMRAQAQRFGKAERRTADPSTSLRSGGDDKGESGASREDWLVAERNSRSLHCATLRVGMTLLFGVGVWKENLGGPRGAPQIPPLRYASVGMTKGRVALPFRFDVAEDE